MIYLEIGIIAVAAFISVWIHTLRHKIREIRCIESKRKFLIQYKRTLAILEIFFFIFTAFFIYLQKNKYDKIFYSILGAFGIYINLKELFKH